MAWMHGLGLGEPMTLEHNWRMGSVGEEGGKQGHTSVVV